MYEKIGKMTKEEIDEVFRSAKMTAIVHTAPQKWQEVQWGPVHNRSDEMQINIDKKVAPIIVGLGAMVVSLILGSFVPLNPNFVQALLAGLAIFFGLVGVLFAAIGTITYFGWS